MDHRLDAQRVGAKNDQCQLAQCRGHSIGIGRQVMRDGADLAPAGQTIIGIKPQDGACHRVTDFSIRHILGDMAGRQHLPRGQSRDLHAGSAFISKLDVTPHR